MPHHRSASTDLDRSSTTVKLEPGIRSHFPSRQGPGFKLRSSARRPSATITRVDGFWLLYPRGDRS